MRKTPLRRAFEGLRRPFGVAIGRIQPILESLFYKKYKKVSESGPFELPPVGLPLVARSPSEGPERISQSHTFSLPCRGLEPPRIEMQLILNQSCLPFHHQGSAGLGKGPADRTFELAFFFVWGWRDLNPHDLKNRQIFVPL
jgi:hypothetical protein